MVYGGVVVGVSVYVLGRERRAMTLYLTVVCVRVFAPRMFERAPLIRALENGPCSGPSACDRRLLHMIWDRCVEKCGLVDSGMYFESAHNKQSPLCVHVCEARLRLKSVSVCMCVRMKQQDRTLRLKSESVSVCVCVCTPGRLHGLCAPIPDYPKFIFLLPTDCVTS